MQVARAKRKKERKKRYCTRHDVNRILESHKMTGYAGLVAKDDRKRGGGIQARSRARTREGKGKIGIPFG